MSQTLSASALAGAILALAPLFSALPASADVYKLDSNHTEVRFSWDHLGLSRQAGTIRKVAGTVAFDPKAPQDARIDVRMRVADLKTGVKALDDQLTASNEFFQVADHPEISFRSTAIVMTSAKTANVAGDLTINGVTHPTTLSVVWNFTGAHPLADVNPAYAGVFASGFSARTRIMRSKWGIKRSIPLVSDEIRISIETEMSRISTLDASQ